MKPDNTHSKPTPSGQNLEKEVVELLEAGSANLPAGTLSRLRASREASLDALNSSKAGWFGQFNWRPALATAALGLLAAVLLLAPTRPEPADGLYTESWLAGDEYFSGDDLSLYLWLNETSELEGGYEG